MRRAGLEKLSRLGKSPRDTLDEDGFFWLLRQMTFIYRLFSQAQAAIVFEVACDMARLSPYAQ